MQKDFMGVIGLKKYMKKIDDITRGLLSEYAMEKNAIPYYKLKLILLILKKL